MTPALAPTPEAFLNAHGTAQMYGKTPQYEETPKTLRAVGLADFLALDLPPRENILAPILQTQSLSMLYAPRGVGKTFVALSVAYAIASGGTCLKWTAPKPRRVLYIDGEMPAATMQERLAQIVKQAEREAREGHFTLITPDMNHEAGMPDLSTTEGQEAIAPCVQNADVIVVDNISTLARTGKENEAESWLPLQRWGLAMRAQGRSVLFVHHAGKGGNQRGTSRREDVLDTVVALRRPQDYTPQDGARFEVHFEKARGLMGPDVAPFEAYLTGEGWTYKSLENADAERVVRLKADGLSLRDIAEETGISKSRVGRLLKEQKEVSQCPVPSQRDSGTPHSANDRGEDA
jgi:putative DNA primase/helicase